jgi:hypothetical protein
MNLKASPALRAVVARISSAVITLDEIVGDDPTGLSETVTSSISSAPADADVVTDKKNIVAKNKI